MDSYLNCYSFPFQFFYPEMSFLSSLDLNHHYSSETTENHEIALKSKYQRTWTKAEIAEIYRMTVNYSQTTGKPISFLDLTDFSFIGIGKRQNPNQIMKKMKEVHVNGTLKPGQWSQEEDNYLIELIGKEKIPWPQIAKILNQEFHENLSIRNSKTCQERWNNYLNPNIKKGKFTSKEDLLLIKGFLDFGNKWKSIKQCLPDRTEGAIKNRCKAILRKMQQEFKDEDLVRQQLIQIKQGLGFNHQ